MANKLALITGATSGIGAAFAKRFASEGYDLIVTGRRKEKIEAFAEAIRGTDHVAVEVVLTELSEKTGIQKVIEAMQGKQVEILVNNAGFGANSLFYECDLEVAEQLANVSVIAPMELIRAVLPDMVKRKSGTIINISSESVYMIVSRNSVYSGSKAFLKSFTEGLYVDLIGTGVKVMAVCPGLTHTDFHEKMGMEKARQVNNGLIQWMSPDEIVDSALRDLAKNKVVSIPGMHAKLLTFFLNHMPRKAYYRFMYQFSRKRFQKEAS